MKTCITCQISKDPTCFSASRAHSDGLQPKCKECNKAYMKEWYSTNKERVKNSNNQRHRLWAKVKKAELLQVIYKIKSNPCTDCGNGFNPWQMQFDHLDPAHKKYNIASMVSCRMPLEKILGEIEKCELVCANCHAHRTYLRKQQSLG